MEAPVLVLTGNVPALGVIRGLGEHGVPVALAYYNDHDMAHASKHVVESFRTSHPVVDERAFVDEVIERGRPLRGALLVPTADETLAAVSRFRSVLEEHFVVGCPDWLTVETCLDKALTARFAHDHGLSAPRTLEPHSVEEALSVADTVGYPLLVKPAQSHLYFRAFNRKMVRADDREHLRTSFLEAEGAGLKVMLQEIIPGPDDQVVNYNSYCWEGRVLVEFTARQLRKAPPRFGSPRVLVSEWIPEAVGPGRDIMAALAYCGFANIELKRDPRDGRFKLMEINARHNMSSLLAVRCGVNFPVVEYRHRMRGELPEPLRQREGMYWCNNLQDLAYSLRGFRDEGLSVAAYVRPYLRPHCDAILDRHDLGPFRARVSYQAGRVLRVGSGTVARAAGGAGRIRPWEITGERGSKRSMLSRVRRLPGVSTVIQNRTVGRLIHRAMLRWQPRRSLPYTQFLRAPAQFDALVGPVVEHLLLDRDRSDLDIAVWGCSSGAEPYSIASVLLSRRPGLEFVIRAFDIDDQLLERARAATYTRGEVFDNAVLDPAFVDATFLVDGDTYRVKPEVSGRVRFERRDILETYLDKGVAPCDIAFAQNILFHLEPEEATQALDNICRLLRPRAALFVDGADLDLRTRSTRAHGLVPLDYRIGEIHAEGLLTRGYAWPTHYWGLEPLTTARRDWKRRYCTIFLRGDRFLGELGSARADTPPTSEETGRW